MSTPQVEIIDAEGTWLKPYGKHLFHGYVNMNTDSYMNTDSGFVLMMYLPQEKCFSAVFTRS